jgi:hypothetical protein
MKVIDKIQENKTLHVPGATYASMQQLNCYEEMTVNFGISVYFCN